MKRFPFRVTLVLCMVLIITALSMIQTGTAIAWRRVLLEFEVSPHPSITAASGIVWGILGLINLSAIWQKRSWAGKLVFGSAAGYTLWFWVAKLIWQAPHPNWAFAVILNLFSLGLILYSYKTLSREAYEQPK